MNSPNLPEYELSLLYLGSANFSTVSTLLKETNLTHTLEQAYETTLADNLNQFDVVISELPLEIVTPPSLATPCVGLAEKISPEKRLQLVLSGYHSVLELEFLPYLPQALISAALQKKYRVESQQAERIMLLSERRYRRLFEAAHDPILVINGRNQRVVDANPEVLQLLELTRHEIIGQCLPDLVNVNRTMWEGLIKAGGPNRSQKIGVHLTNRNKIKLVVDIVASKFEEGGHDILQVSLKDQTLQHLQHQQIRQQVDELAASEERFRVLSNQSPTPTLVVDINTGSIDYANLRAQTLMNDKSHLSYAIGNSRSEEILQTISECGVLIDHYLQLPPPHGEILVNGELSRFQGSPVAHLVFVEK